MSRTRASPSGELREFANVLNAADADSIYLYLPRNLSSCHMCAEVEEQHWEHKMKLLAGFLRRESLDSGDDDVLSMKPIPAGGLPRAAVGSAPRGILRRDAPKTSPAWPARRRRGRLVTFADALGLELEHVRRLVHRVRTPAAAAAPDAAAAALEAEFSLASGDELRRRVRRDKDASKEKREREKKKHMARENDAGRRSCTARMSSGGEQSVALGDAHYLQTACSRAAADGSSPRRRPRWHPASLELEINCPRQCCGDTRTTCAILSRWTKPGRCLRPRGAPSCAYRVASAQLFSLLFFFFLALCILPSISADFRHPAGINPS
ncbi:uncharacterized protein [Dermacentor albipictus]|uniref:uncharacterized protein isoform X1 n=1 Tax=Dermacentor albipictus TaxID=60249 RepID=UPI0038FC9A2D